MNDFIDSLFDTIASMLANVDAGYLYTHEIEGLIKIGAQSDVTMAGINAIYKVFAPIAMYLLLIYGLMAILDLFSHDNMTFEQIAKVLVRFGIAVLLITQGGTVIGGLAMMGDATIDEVKSAITTASGKDDAFKQDYKVTQSVTLGSLASTAVNAATDVNLATILSGSVVTGAPVRAGVAMLREIIKGDTVYHTESFEDAIKVSLASNRLGFLKGLILLLLALPIALIGKIVGLIICVQCITRKVEIMIRLGFSSLAFSELYGDIHRSNAIKYFKKILALAIQGVGIMFAFYIIASLQHDHLNAFVQALNGSGETSFYSAECFGELCWAILYEFVAVGIIATIKQIVNDALGC